MFIPPPPPKKIVSVRNFLALISNRLRLQLIFKIKDHHMVHVVWNSSSVVFG